MHSELLDTTTGHAGKWVSFKDNIVTAIAKHRLHSIMIEGWAPPKNLESLVLHTSTENSNA